MVPKNVVLVRWRPRKKAANIVAGGKIMKVEKVLGDWVVAWKKMTGEDPGP